MQISAYGAMVTSSWASN